MQRQPIALESLGLDDAKLAKLRARFWSRVDRSGGPDACWPWMGRREVQHGEYGSLEICGRRWRASRIAYELTVGPLDDYACHSCDNPPCCNPSHIFDGTQRNNIEDAQAKGRIAAGDAHGLRQHPEMIARGERHGGARLSETDVIGIREAAARGELHADIADRHSVSAGTISEIANGHKWSHVAGPRSTRPTGARGERNGSAKLTDADVVAIRNELSGRDGRSGSDRGLGVRAAIAKRYGVTKGTIDHIMQGKRALQGNVARLKP